MPAKIRLARHGRKARPIYHIVVADSRAPRDGKYIEKLGLFNPNTNPATIDLNFDKAVDWLLKGAQPTDTCRSILSAQGAMMKKHLLGGVTKGAFSEDEANVRFDKWMKEKEAKKQAELTKLSKEAEAAKKELLDQETKIKEERAAEIAKKKAEAVAAEQEEEVAEETTEEAAAETKATPEAETAEEPKAEEKAPEVVEEPKAEEKAPEVVEEPKAEEAKEEEPKAEKAEAKTEEPKVEEKEPEVKAAAPEAEEKPAEEAKDSEEEKKAE